MICGFKQKQILIQIIFCHILFDRHQYGLKLQFSFQVDVKLQQKYLLHTLL